MIFPALWASYRYIICRELWLVHCAVCSCCALSYSSYCFGFGFDSHLKTTLILISNDTLCECFILAVDSITYSSYFSLLIALGQNKYRYRNGWYYSRLWYGNSHLNPFVLIPDWLSLTKLGCFVLKSCFILNKYAMLLDNFILLCSNTVMNSVLFSAVSWTDNNMQRQKTKA